MYLKSHKHHVNNDTSLKLSSSDLIDDEEEYEIEEILNWRYRKEWWQYEIKWIFTTEYNEWIFKENISNLKILQQKYDVKMNANCKHKMKCNY